MSMQKQKLPDTDDPKKKPGDAPKADPKLKEALGEGKALLDRMEQAVKKKRGHWEHCCGARIWVED